MEMDKIETLPPPPGVIGSLKAGFDAIASNITVILLPLALDLLLWLGPRLRIDRLFRPMFDEISRYMSSSGIPATDVQMLQENSSQALEWLHQYNLLTVLRTFPIGVFSLMSDLTPNRTPIGVPSVIQVGSIFTLFGWIMLMTLFGWILGGIFFRWVSMAVSDTSRRGHFAQAILQTILISILYFMIAMILGLPITIVLSLIGTVSSLLAQGMLLVLGLFSMWLIVPLFFTPHGIFMYQQNAFSSIYTSLKMARFTLPTSSLFVLSVLIIAFGLNYLWAIPSSDSWMTLIGIVGHAFITTSLLAASFIFYRDMQVWLQTILERLKTNLPV